MTVSALVTRNDITATASQTSFTYTFRVLEATDMDVYQNGALLASGYTVNDVGVNTGGTVTLAVGVPVGQIVSLVLAMPLDRTTNYQNSGDFLAGDVNGDFDKIYIGAIQNENEGGRSLRLKDVEPPTAGVDMTIPLKADRLGKFLAFDSVTGGPIAGSGAAFFDSAAWSVYDFTGDGSTVAFTLGSNPATENNTQVYIDGVYQQKDGYSVAGAVLTFSVAPPNLSTIEVMVIAILPIGSTSSDLVSYAPAGTGAVASNVQTKLRESVSVKDFGATGDGTTDDTLAIQAAINYVASNSGVLTFPSGTYMSDSLQVTPTASFKINGTGTIKKRTNAANNMLQIQGTTLPISVTGITLDGDFTTHSEGGQGLVGYNISNMIVDGVTVTDVKNSGVIIFTDGTIHENNIIRNCTVNGEAHIKNGLLIVDCKNSGIETSSVFNVTEFALELKNSCTNCWIRNCLVDICDLQAIVLGQTTGTGPSHCDISNVTIKASDGAIELSNGQYNTFNQITCDFTGNPTPINNGINCGSEVKNCTFTNITMLNLPTAIYAIRFRTNNINNLVKFSSIEKDGAGDAFRFDASATLNTVVADRYSIADVLKEDLRPYVSDASSGGTNLLVSLRTTATENNDTPTGSNTGLNDVGDVINTQNKYAGKRVWNTSDNRPVYAVGSAAADVWKKADGTTHNTPV
jgi:polygalacturonase